MSSALALAGLDERYEPGRARSVALAFVVHAAMLAVLTLGIRWQSHPPETVVVELWEPLPAMPQPEVPKAIPEAPPKAAAPEPRLEKPDIAVKAPRELKLKPATTLKPGPDRKPKPRATPRPASDEFQRRMREELAREQATLRAEREEAEMRELIARSAASARGKALADYEARIRGKVRGNVVLPHDIEGNPEAIFDVVQLPTGEVLSVKLRKSSGHKGYDDAVERAILKSSPLPKPLQSDIFSRELKLTFRPLDR